MRHFHRTFLATFLFQYSRTWYYSAIWALCRSGAVWHSRKLFNNEKKADVNVTPLQSGTELKWQNKNTMCGNTGIKMFTCTVVLIIRCSHNRRKTLSLYVMQQCISGSSIAQVTSKLLTKQNKKTEPEKFTQKNNWNGNLRNENFLKAQPCRSTIESPSLGVSYLANPTLLLAYNCNSYTVARGKYSTQTRNKISQSGAMYTYIKSHKKYKFIGTLGSHAEKNANAIYHKIWKNVIQ